MMTSNSASRTQQDLTQALTTNRRESMKATERGDIRIVARLTLEAAELNKAIAAKVSPESPSF
jgi:hypothetical protein